VDNLQLTSCYLGADKSYDSAEFRCQLRDDAFNLPYPGENGLSVVVDLPTLPGPMKLAEVAGKVEHNHGWLDNWQRLVVRYDWYAQSYVAFLTITCFMTVLQGFWAR
jgi:hypothetical protein